MKRRMTSSSRRTPIRKAQTGRKELQRFEDFTQDTPYVRYTGKGIKQSFPVPKNPYKGRTDVGGLVGSALYDTQPWVKRTRKELEEAKSMTPDQYEAKVNRENYEVSEDLRRMKERETLKKEGGGGNKQRRGGKTAIKKSATASRMKAKAGKKVVARKAVATKKAKTGARTSYKRK